MKTREFISILVIVVLLISVFYHFDYQRRQIQAVIEESKFWIDQEQWTPTWLYRDSPIAKPKTIWIKNDNQLVAKVCGFPSVEWILKHIYSEYLRIGAPMEVLIYEEPLIPPYNATVSIVLNEQLNYTIMTEIVTDRVMEDWDEYADLLAYGALSYHYLGDWEKAQQYFLKMYKMWDGVGLVDKAFTGEYQTYKTALFVITCRELGLGELWVYYDARKILQKCYRDGGGFYTGYDATHKTKLFNKYIIKTIRISEGVDVNTETTCLVIMALERGVCDC